MLEGTVKWFSLEKGYGFIKRKGGGKDVFVHINEVLDSGYKTLYEKEEVEFEIVENDRGQICATNITAFEYVDE